MAEFEQMLFFLPQLTYCCVVWHSCISNMPNSLQRVQNYAMCIDSKKPPWISSEFCCGLLDWLTLLQYRCTTLL